jgi:hypothetical protein
MTHERDLDRVLDRWMDDGPTVVADRVIATAMTDVHTTRQRGARWARLKELFMTMKPAATLVAVTLIAVLGIAVYQFILGGGPRNIGDDPPPTPTPRAFEDASGELEPGTYASSIDSVEITYTVPAGWTNDPAAPELAGPYAGETGGLSFWIVTDLFADPCRFDQGTLDPPPGPSIDDLANALVAQPGVDAAPPSDIVVDGFAGTYVEYTTPATGCDAFGPWQTPNGVVLFPSTDVRYWILDVDGTRLVMLAYLWDDATEEGRAELQAIIDSVEITP